MRKTILILAANPKDTPKLRLDEEVREIDNGLQRAQKRDEFILKQVWATRFSDVRRAMLDLKPNIVHFCGHGSGEEGIAFEDELGDTKLVRAETLATFFDLFSESLECVVLNACYSEVQAEAISQYVNYVIGMRQEIKDKAAIEFSVALYDALGAGRSIDFAYRLACNAIRWTSLSDHLIPVMKVKAIQKGESQLDEGQTLLDSFEWNLLRENIEAQFDLDACFVRERELTSLREQLVNGVSLAIIGDFGSGKTSLLRRLCESKDHQVGYLDLAEKAIQYRSEFLRCVASALSGSDSGEIDNFRDIHENLDRNENYVLCLDNIDELVRNPTFDSSLLYELRQYTHGRGFVRGINLTIVISTKTTKLINLSPGKSPWYNNYFFRELTDLSELRLRNLLKCAGINSVDQINFCFEAAKRYLPLDFLILAYYLKTHHPISYKSYDFIKQNYESAIAYFMEVRSPIL